MGELSSTQPPVAVKRFTEKTIPSSMLGAMASDPRDEKHELLRRLPLFEGVAERALEALSPGLRVLQVGRRDELFHRGDDGAQLYLVVEGRFKAMTTSRLGDDVVFEVMGPGDVFGESGFTRKAGRIQTVRAIDAGCVLVIDRPIRRQSLTKREYVARLALTIFCWPVAVFWDWGS